jgi:hypothetical protein
MLQRSLRGSQTALSVSAARSLATVGQQEVDVVICGAGVVGCSAAHYLTRDHGLRVLLIDERPPLSYTSSMSTECYRNFWGDNTVMTEFMNRSIELLEERALESNNQFSMNRKGYHFLSADPKVASEHLEAAKLGEAVGIGPTNVFSGSGHGQNYSGTLPNDPDITGIDLYQGSEAVQEFLPGFVTDECISLMHVKRCGFMNAQQVPFNPNCLRKRNSKRHLFFLTWCRWGHICWRKRETLSYARP